MSTNTGEEPGHALLDAATRATGGVIAFAAVVVVLRLESGRLAAALGLCIALLAALGAIARLDIHRLARTRAGSLAPIVAATALGASLAMLGLESQVLFLPILFLLFTVSLVWSPLTVASSSCLVASGWLWLALGAAGGTEQLRLLASAVVLIALPTTSAWLAERERRGESSPDESAENSPAPTSGTLPALGLTPRQSEVVDLLATGLRHGEIAERLGISVHQVRRLLSQARERTDAKTTRQLVASRFEPSTSDKETGSGPLRTETTSAIS